MLPCQILRILHDPSRRGSLSFSIAISVWSYLSYNSYPSDIGLRCSVIKNGSLEIRGRCRDDIFGWGDVEIVVQDKKIIFERWRCGNLQCSRTRIYRIVLEPHGFGWSATPEGDELLALRERPKQAIGELEPDRATISFKEEKPIGSDMHRTQRQN